MMVQGPGMQDDAFAERAFVEQDCMQLHCYDSDYADSNLMVDVSPVARHDYSYPVQAGSYQGACRKRRCTWMAAAISVAISAALCVAGQTACQFEVRAAVHETPWPDSFSRLQQA